MSDAPEVNPAPAKTQEAHPLDALTGGAFSAATSGERASRIRDWLATQPAPEQLQEVFKELSGRDKGAARAVRERLDEIRRAKGQEAIAAEWAEKAQALLAAPKLNIADALAWQRDAAKAGAPLSREPLSLLKVQVADRVKVIEDLQHRVQVQREAAVLLAQRIEVLSTKPWRDAQAALELLRGDVARWQEQAQELTGDASWASVEARFPPLLDASRTQLLVVWDAFQPAVAQAAAAAEDANAPLPPVPVWADELRVARGLPTEAAAAAAATAPGAAAKPARAQNKPKVDPEVREKAVQAVREALVVLEKETAEGHGKASAGAAAALRAVLKNHGKHIDAALEQQVHTALVAAGELEGWQRWGADQVREDLVAKAEGLLNRPEGQALGGRKMQETLRALREQWKQADQGGAPNHGLWKKFDEACNAAHKVVEGWLDKIRADAAEHKAQRLALIEEVKAWTQEHANSGDWKAINRALYQFGDRWREGGHVGEKIFAELQPLWKQAIAAAGAPLDAAQKDSLARRHAMIDEAVALGAAPALRIDAVKALQQRWQAEAQTVPLDRKHEQKLWDAFRKPIDEAFNRKSADREKAATELSARDRVVLDASKALEAANATGDAQQIRAAVQALEAALRGQAQAAEAAAASAPKSEPVAAAQAADAGSEAPADGTAAEGEAAAAAPAPVAPPKPARPVVAVRGDDRPGMKKDAPAAPGRGARPGERRDGGRGDAGRGGPRDGRPGDRGGERGGRFGDRERPAYEDRGPRLGDTAFRAQRDAMEHAQLALKKLAAQAHGEALTQLLSAWEKRDAAQVPSAQELGGRVTPAVRTAWTQALSAAPKGDAAEALLRLEMAAEVPTPAEHIAARRLLQLQLLTRRNDPAPEQTWGQDAAKVLASGSDAATARRLQNVLKNLLRK
ncbi:ribonuclease HI [Acidovorax soli]|uniref:Ribonuclease HI n=2 Tax=Acidovorax soli TaxID=592050 RepID=A0A7X0PIG3_9BURK|nr:ribonuclease HI [Acidovorax soli]